MENRKKLVFSLTMLFIINIVLILFITNAPGAEAAVYRQGSTGSTVSIIQQKLKNWGYYSGTVDGIFGSRTTDAVKYFQRTNGLTADGVVGTQTLAALGMPTGSGTSSTSSNQSNDLELLARLISAEARGETYTGQVAVGAVVLNRVRHPSFPNTMSGVIYQNGAFSCLDDGQFWQPIAESSRKAARDAMNGWDPSGGAIYYYNPQTATNKWIRSRPVVTQIGKHVFCM